MSIANSFNRYHQLREIERTMHRAQHSSVGGPAAGSALLWSVAAFSLASLTRSQLAESGVTELPWWTLIIAALGAYAIVVIRAPYKSYTPLIYDLLTDYEPKNTVAYKKLQADVAEYGLTREVIETWMIAERDSLSQPQQVPEAKQRFLNKQVGLHLARTAPPASNADQP